LDRHADIAKSHRYDAGKREDKRIRYTKNTIVYAKIEITQLTKINDYMYTA